MRDQPYEDEGVKDENTEVTKFLNAIRKMKGAYAIKIHGDQFCMGEPDVVGSYAGKAFAIEFKRSPREKLRPLQIVKLRLWESSFAFTGVYWRASDALEALAVFGSSQGLGGLQPVT